MVAIAVLIMLLVGAGLIAGVLAATGTFSGGGAGSSSPSADRVATRLDSFAYNEVALAFDSVA
jgi:hypothetical protein